MKDTFILNLKSGKQVKFEIRSFHYLNFDLRRTFDTEYPTIVVLYKWDDKNRVKLSRITVKVIENPKTFFNSEPISDELKQTILVLILDEAMPSPRERALEYLDKLQHEVIDSSHTFLQFGFDPN